MDLKAYYRKIREIEEDIGEEFSVVKSLKTESGGQQGRLTEVQRSVAAKMIVDGTAEIASPAEVNDWRTKREAARNAEEQRRRAAQVQFTVLSEADLRSLQKSNPSSKKNRE